MRENKSKSKKRSIEVVVQEDSSDEEVPLFNDESDVEEAVEDQNACQACLGTDQQDTAEAWIGCTTCSRWYHRECLQIDFSSMTDEDIENLDFVCRAC